MDCGQKKERLCPENEGQEQKEINRDRIRRTVFTKWQDTMVRTTMFSLESTEHEKVT